MVSRLKSLELQGYKTFANRTIFEFPGAVTAIVGPNGSGKSNITDALRWVLGEQSYSLLRGKKTEDMIFAGSDRRTRSGMATASVILDNYDGWLPIDFSEVEIARRAYRDGSNEYLLNGQRVRLKDVSELLAESGLAERTYTIIGQGLVDAALALRAEDRRRLFEEAAGIGLHRSRREEAIRRLADTQRNLERVEDILIELRPRLRSLERQAQRAQEYESAVSDLRALLREWYGYHWHKAQEELSEAQDLTREKNEILENTREKELQLDKEINSLREKRTELRTKLNEYHRQSSDYHAKRESTSRELAVAEERERNLQIQMEKLNADLVNANEEVNVLEERKRFALEDVENLRSEFEQAEENLRTAKSAFDKRQEERSIIEGKLGELRQELIGLSTAQAALTSRQGEYLTQIDAVNLSITKAREAIQRAVQERERSTNKVDEIKKTLENVEEVQANIEGELDDLQKNLTEKNTQLLELTRTYSGLEGDAAKLSARLDVLKQAERNFAGYSEGAKLLLSAAETKQLRAAGGVLGTKIKVPAQYEAAVGAALGDFVDGLLLENGEEIGQALHLLEESAEKGALLPLGSLYPGKQLISYLDQNGIIGWANNLVEVPDKLKSVIEVLLGSALVVENKEIAGEVLNAARRDSGDENTATLKVVTLKGEVFHATGLIETSAGTTPVSLSRPREERELQNQFKNSQDVLERTKSQILLLENNLQEEREQQEHLRENLEEQIQRKDDIGDAYRQEIAALEQFKREQVWREEQLAGFENEQLRYQAVIKSSEAEYQTLSQQMEDLKADISQLSKRMHDLPIEDLQADVAHWSTRVEILKLSLEESRNRHAERDQLQQTMLARVEAIQKDANEVEESLLNLDKRMGELKESNTMIAERLEATSRLIFPAETELEEVEDQLSQLLRLESKERMVISQAEQNFSQARITQVRKQESLDGLRRQIEADFGLVAFEYMEDVSGPTPLPIDGFVENLPMREELSPEIESSLQAQRALLRRIGPINPEAQIEYQEIAERYEFLSSQVDDLQEASEDVKRVIAELDEIMQREFCNTFDAVADEFHQIFGRLFGGGTARLILTDPDDLTSTGIDIEARLPGRREQGLSLLSGGERSLTAVALVFSLLRVSPTPFCVLDEVDAMLDEANVGRFRELLRELSKTTQFIMITHNRATVQVADIIYGVTMGRDSTSQILSLKVDELEKVIR